MPEKIVMNTDELCCEVFPHLREDSRTRALMCKMPESEKIKMMAREVRKLHSDLAREIAGRKMRDRLLDNLRQLEMVHKAKNYNRRLI